MKKFDDLFKVRQRELPESLRNCFLLSMGRYYQAKGLSQNKGLELLEEIKLKYCVSEFYVKNDIYDQLFLKIKNNAQEEINNHTERMLVTPRITLEEILYLQSVAKIIYIFQMIKLENGEDYSHHEVCYADALMKTEIHTDAKMTYFHIIELKN